MLKVLHLQQISSEYTSEKQSQLKSYMKYFETEVQQIGSDVLKHAKRQNSTSKKHWANLMGVLE